MTRWLGLGLTILLALPGCAEQPVDLAVDRSALEEQVAQLYPTSDESSPVTVSCAGELLAQVGATQDCELDVAGEPADVRVSVSEVTEGVAEIEIVPVVPAVRVAETLRASLVEEGWEVDSVECPAELLGVVDDQVTCTASPLPDGGAVEATVTSVTGLDVDFRYQVLTR